MVELEKASIIHEKRFLSMFYVGITAWGNSQPPQEEPSHEHLELCLPLPPPPPWKLSNEIGGWIHGKGPGIGLAQTQQGGLCLLSEGPWISADSLVPIWQRQEEVNGKGGRPWLLVDWTFRLVGLSTMLGTHTISRQLRQTTRRLPEMTEGAQGRGGVAWGLPPQ